MGRLYREQTPRKRVFLGCFISLPDGTASSRWVPPQSIWKSSPHLGSIWWDKVTSGLARLVGPRCV